MKNLIICCAAMVLLCSSCFKASDALSINLSSSKDTSTDFIIYTIKSGQHYADRNVYKKVNIPEMKFRVRFDSSALYQSLTNENQYDINKLYGFADNNATHHQYSARIGWRWSDNALRLFGYVYNNEIVSAEEITTVGINKEIECSIKAVGNEYIFSVNEVQLKMHRESKTLAAEGYQLYPYFGGDETAPHDVRIWIGASSLEKEKAIDQ